MTGPLQFDQSDEKPDTSPTEGAGEEKPASYGPLYDLAPEKAFGKAEKLWKKAPWASKVLAGEARLNQWVRDGRRFVRFVADQDADSVRLVVPLGMEALPPAPNKVEEIVNNTIAIQMSDPPRPDCEPSGDTAQAREAAQFAVKYLTAIATESGLNTDGVMEALYDIAATYKSGFAEVCHIATGGGLRPQQIEANAQATTVDDATLAGGPLMVKYVRPDGTLSDTPEGAQLVWQSALKINLLTANQVRFLPRKCTGIADADGVVIGRFETLGMLKAKYPDVEKLSPDGQWELAGWKVHDWKRLLPESEEYEAPSRKDSADPDDGPEDDTPICTLTVYYKSGPMYQHGYYGVFAGGKHRIYNGTLVQEMPQSDGVTSPEPLDIPVAQMRWRSAFAKGDPYGETIVKDLAPMDEMRATQYASALEYLYRFTKPRWFLPMGTTVQPEDIADVERPIYFNPNGKPEFAPIPQYPPMGFELVDRLDRDIENRSGINPTSLGQAAGSVRSNEQQKTLIEQANVAQTRLRDNGVDCYERLHRLILQQSRAHISRPTLMSYRGMDGAFQVQEFTGADFGTTKHVRVRKGSFSMLPPTAKNDLILQEMQAGTLDQLEAARLRRDNISPLIGSQDSPHVLQIRRQLQAWRKGPRKELADVQPQPQIDPATGQPAIDPQTGQVVMSDPVAEAAAQVFVMLPVHDEQAVAVLRHQELARAVAEMEFYPHPPAWQQALTNTYLHARMASGQQTIAEQQQAAQAQQQAQQQAEQQKGQEEQAEKESDRDFQRERDAAQAQNREGA